MVKKEKRFNGLFHGFLLISIGLHVFLILNMSSVYQKESMSYIELSIRQLPSPPSRLIPTPRRFKTVPKKVKVSSIQVKNFKIPKMMIDNTAHQTSHLPYQNISLPEFPENIGVLKLSDANLKMKPQMPEVEATVKYSEFSDIKAYFEMLNQRIDSKKKYPESARSNYIEGRVHIEFFLLKDGTLSDIKILKSSYHRNLDDAAVDAVKKASPFPRPSPDILKLPVILQVSILFELA